MENSVTRDVFDAIDTDRDGYITRDEVLDLIQYLRFRSLISMAMTAPLFVENLIALGISPKKGLWIPVFSNP